MDSLDYYKIEELLTDEERAARDRASAVCAEGSLVRGRSDAIAPPNFRTI